MVNQFKSTTYRCNLTGRKFACMYPSDLEDQGHVRGTAVLDAYHYPHDSGKLAEWLGILISIIAVYRILGYLVLALQRH